MVYIFRSVPTTSAQPFTKPMLEISLLESPRVFIFYTAQHLCWSATGSTMRELLSAGIYSSTFSSLTGSPSVLEGMSHQDRQSRCYRQSETPLAAFLYWTEQPASH